MPRKLDALPYGMHEGSILHDLHKACLAHGFKKNKDSRWGMICDHPSRHAEPEDGSCLFQYRLYTRKRGDGSCLELVILHHEPDDKFRINVCTKQKRKQHVKLAECRPTKGSELDDACAFLDGLPA